jgi:hypothetical protein
MCLGCEALEFEALQEEAPQAAKEIAEPRFATAANELEVGQQEPTGSTS